MNIEDLCIIPISYEHVLSSFLRRQESSRKGLSLFLCRNERNMAACAGMTKFQIC